MKAFTQIAIPHEDIVKGRLTMDVFAADLWQVANGGAPEDYQDPDLFFKKTYQTDGLKNILGIAKIGLKEKAEMLSFSSKLLLVEVKPTRLLLFITKRKNGGRKLLF